MEREQSEELIVGGFRFGSLQDASLAREEEKKIKYITSRLNYNDPKSVLVIYNKMIQNRIFVTPVGNLFLSQIHDYLLSVSDIEEAEVSPIPLYASYSPSANPLNEEGTLPRMKIKPKMPKTYRKEYVMSRIIIAILVVAVGAMFYITLKADNPNILNYKTAIENQYADWEQQLRERERAVREKEKELNIIDDNNSGENEMSE